MNTPMVRALLWEQFRKTYVLWLCALGISLLGCLLAVVVVQMDAADMVQNGHVISTEPFELAQVSEDASDVFWRFFWIALVLYTAGILYLQDGTGDLKLLIPVYQLRRPVSTFVLVLCRYFYDVLSAGALVTCSLLLHEIALPQGVTQPIDLWQILLCTLAITAYVRTLAWTLGGLGTPLVALLGLVLLGLVLTGLIAFLGGPESPGVSLLAITVAVVLGGFGISMMAIARQRSGRHLSWAPLWRLVDVRPARLQEQDAPFVNAHAAMQWFERRRQAYLYPSIIYLILMSVTGPLALFRAQQDYKMLQLDLVTFRIVQADAVFLSLLDAIGCATLIAGGIFCFMNQRAYMTPASHFLYIRPITTPDLARARLWVVGRRAAFALLPVAIFGLFLHEIERVSPENTLLNGMLPQFGMLGTLLIFALAFLGILGLAWSGLWLGNVIAVATVCIVFRILVALWGVSWELADETVFLYCGAVCAMVLGALWHRCWRRGFVGRRAIGQFLLAGAVLALAYFLLYNFEWLENGKTADYGWSWTWGIPVVVALSLAPRLTVPLIMDWARHR